MLSNLSNPKPDHLFGVKISKVLLDCLTSYSKICRSCARNNSVADSKDERYTLLNEQNMYLINKSF